MTDRSLDSGPMALSVTGAAKHYISGFTLNDVTFDLPAGYVMGLIGPMDPVNPRSSNSFLT